MSFNLQFSGHTDPANPETDAKLRKMARAFSDMLNANGIPHSGIVVTPTNPDSGAMLDLPDQGSLVVSGSHLHTAGSDVGGSATNQKPK